MIRAMNYKGFIIINVNLEQGEHFGNFMMLGESVNQFHVYEPFALAYLDGNNFPPEEFHLCEVDSEKEAHAYIDSSIEAMNRGIEADRRKIYGDRYPLN